MLADSNINLPKGNFSGITPNKTISRIIDFVESLFQVFINKIKSSGKTSEEDLTQELVIILDRESKRSKFPFSFHKEYKYKNRRVDIGVLESPLDDIEIEKHILEITPANEPIYKSYHDNLSSDPIFCIEAKRLPVKEKHRKLEYVIGHGGAKGGDLGGIQRFKEKHHAHNLSSSAILGYIQKETFSHWFTQINSWIDNLILTDPTNWNSDDKLVNFTADTIKARSESKHLKTDKTYINLNHLWVSLV